MAFPWIQSNALGNPGSRTQRRANLAPQVSLNDRVVERPIDVQCKQKEKRGQENRAEGVYDGFRGIALEEAGWDLVANVLEGPAYVSIDVISASRGRSRGPFARTMTEDPQDSGWDLRHAVHA